MMNRTFFMMFYTVRSPSYVNMLHIFLKKQTKEKRMLISLRLSDYLDPLFKPCSISAILVSSIVQVISEYI